MEKTIFPPSQSKFNIYKWLTIAAILVIVYLAFCNKSSIPEPVVKTVKEQQIILQHDTVEHKFNTDSINKIISDLTGKANYWHNAFNVSANEAVSLQNSLSDYISHTVIPDTCKDIVANIQSQFERVIAANRKANEDCNNTINFKDLIIGQKDAVIKEDSTAYRKMIDNVDTALAQQKKLTDYIKKIRPRTTIYVGAIATGSKEKYFSGFGINLGLMNKKGTMYEAGAIQMGLQTHYSLSIKKPLFRL